MFKSLNKGISTPTAITIIVLCAFLVGGVVVYQYYGIPKEEEETPETIKPPKDETADWETYRNGEYGFEIKYPKDWKMESTFPGRLGPGQTEFRPGINPQIFSFVPSEIDLTKEKSEISIYVAPPEYFTCPPVKGDTSCIDGQDSKITIDSIEGIMREGTTTEYCPPEGKEVKEVYFCKSNNYFRFSTTKQKERVFDQMLSTFRFLEEEKIQTGKFEIDYDRINELQKAVDEGHHPWRLDLKLVITAEGLGYGFTDNDFKTMKQVFFAASAGVAKYEITHQNMVYIVTVIQPIPGEGKIWIISEIQEK